MSAAKAMVVVVEVVVDVLVVTVDVVVVDVEVEEPAVELVLVEEEVVVLLLVEVDVLVVLVVNRVVEVLVVASVVVVVEVTVVVVVDAGTVVVEEVNCSGDFTATGNTCPRPMAKTAHSKTSRDAPFMQISKNLTSLLLSINSFHHSSGPDSIGESSPADLPVLPKTSFEQPALSWEKTWSPDPHDKISRWLRRGHQDFPDRPTGL